VCGLRRGVFARLLGIQSRQLERDSIAVLGTTRLLAGTENIDKIDRRTVSVLNCAGPAERVANVPLDDRALGLILTIYFGRAEEPIRRLGLSIDFEGE
jgi:hypothetical protein